METAPSCLLLLALTTACAEDEVSLDDAQAGNSSLDGTEKELQARLQELETIVSRLGALVEKNERALKNAQSESEVTQASYAAALEKNEKLHEELQAAQLELASLQASFRAAEEQLGDLKSDKQALLALLDSSSQEFFGKLEQLEDQVKQLEQRLSEAGFPLSLRFSHRVGERELVRGRQYSVGDASLSVSEIRYWVSGVKLLGVNGEEVLVPDSYYLVEDAPEQSTHSNYVRPARKRDVVTLLQIPTGEYQGIKFSVGVDPLYNDNLSLHAGELHVLSNMAHETWMWFTSYIFTKFSGSYETDAGERVAFSWDTGSNATYRSVSLEFPQTVNLGESGAVQLNLQVDVLELLAPFLAEGLPAVIGPQKQEQMILLADAYSRAFTLENVSAP